MSLRDQWQAHADQALPITATEAEVIQARREWYGQQLDRLAAIPNRRVQEVAPMIRAAGHEMQCLRITRSGYPQHPLYLPGDCTLQPYSLGAIEAAMAA